MERSRILEDRDTKKADFEQRLGKMLEASELKIPIDQREGLIEYWPGGNIPVYPQFQFTKEGKPRKLFFAALDAAYETYSNRNALVQVVIGRMFRKGHDGVSVMDLVMSGKKKLAAERAREMDRSLISLY